MGLGPVHSPMALRLADHEVRPPKCPSAPSLGGRHVPMPSGPMAPAVAQMKGSLQPMSKRYDVSCEILGRETGKPRPQLQAILKSMRRPIHEIHGLDAEHWYAAVDRARSAERRRRGGVDKRPVPSWNFRGGGPLKPVPAGHSPDSELPAVSLRWKLSEQLQRQAELKAKLRELEEPNERLETMGPGAEEVFPTSFSQMDEATVQRLVEEQRAVQDRLHAKLEHLLDGDSRSGGLHPKDRVPVQEKQLLAENQELERRLQKQMEEVQSQEEALQRLQEQAKHLQSTAPSASLHSFA